MSAAKSPTDPALIRAVDDFLLTALADLHVAPPLAQAMQYALLQGGKRLRPLLVIHSAHALGGSLKAALPPAAALEMIHAFSLVHDDLPAMDDDALRRGQPTCHIKFDEATAILAGDALATVPYAMLVERVQPLDVAARLVHELAQASLAMISGQVYDTVGGFHDSTPPRTQLETTHREKTGALIRAACRMGAITANANERQLEALTRYGETTGLLFQVIDDILDETQSEEHLGKRAGKDLAAGKKTYPGIIGLEESRKLATSLETQAQTHLDVLGSAAQPLRDLAQYMAVRTK